MAESAGKQLLLSALTEGHEKRSKTSKINQNKSASKKNTATGSEKGTSDRNRSKRQKGGFSSGGQTTVTSTSSSSSKCKHISACAKFLMFIFISSIFNILLLSITVKSNPKNESINSLPATSKSSSTSSRTHPRRKRLLNILLNTNSTTEDDTEEEVPATSSSNNKKTKRRRRNFSSSTSSSYSSSLATTSTVHSTSLTTAAGSSSRKQDSKDLIAFRTRSRTHSVERQEEPNSPSEIGETEQRPKASRSRSHLIRSDSGEDDSQEEQDTIVSQIKKSKTQARLSRSSSSKLNKSSVNNKETSSTRQLRSSQNRRVSPEPASSVPKKRQRFGEASVLSTPQSSSSSHSAVNGSTNNEGRTGSSNKTVPNLGTKLAKNYSGREPQPFNSVNNSQNPQPPQNLLRRSSRGKGVTTSSSTTGSCVSLQLLSFENIN